MSTWKEATNEARPVPYSGVRVLITGGLGFIGSNLAIRLVELGARVVIVDSMVPGCGANLYNVTSVADQVQIIREDIAEAAKFRDVLQETRVIFNLAGEISHINSMQFPVRDAILNATAQLRFLKECAAHAPGIRVVYAGTRQIYGIPKYLPVDEDHPIDPIDFNGVHKRAAMMYHLLYSRENRMDAAVLNLTNVYGPRMAIRLSHQGFLGAYIRRVATGEPPEIYGDGEQLRDPLYIDDAVRAFLAAGSAPRLPSRVYNVGGPRPLQIREIAEIARQAGNAPPAVFKPFPREQRAIHIGSYYTNSTRILRELGWAPEVDFADGIRRTLAYYRGSLRQYLPQTPANPDQIDVEADRAMA
ncbi:MAG TPA: NAD-dependent epimerase/dehydratase family protein [Bryobacterales bacterium]|nr:NAD-dependent epimerase/dehydratase family protein [Bryobacterales bacterium]